MSGHNKWSSIKHKKGKADAARGRVFSKLVKEITVAAREGGGDPETNSRLRVAVESAKAKNMPNDNIERAIKRGTGELEGTSYEEITYEAYGPGGVAILIDVLTDNRNRATAEIRHILSKGGGHLGSRNSVAYMFHTVGQIFIDGSKFDEDTVLEAALEAGADDVQFEEDSLIVTSDPSDLSEVRKGLEDYGIEVEDAEVTKRPDALMKPSPDEAEKALKLLLVLEEHDDVQDVHTNLDLSD
ncbi:YebC/PmpR family DNA-binding transcriptional regulator [Candidatus Fermentibacteria bacterium]|nr:YebC/PmpR family DNA-binding transcriptional regulator [Candidatus Fermentibacteria bacterium]